MAGINKENIFSTMLDDLCIQIIEFIKANTTPLTKSEQKFRISIFIQHCWNEDGVVNFYVKSSICDS